MELKPGYKQTEIGVIPEDWDAVDLYNVCTMKSGEGITSKRVDNCSPYPCYGGNGLRGFTTRYTHDGSFALIGRQGALCGNVVPAEGQFFASEHAVVVSARQGVDIRWLTYVLGRMHLNRYSESSAQPGLSVSKVLKLPLAFPPIESEQCAIATALSDADALLDGLDQLIAKKRDLKQASMQQLLTGETRLPGFEGEWEHRSLIEIAEFQKSNFEDGDWIEAEHITDRGIRLIQTGNIGIGSFVEKDVRKYIYEESFIKLRCKELRVGDILICRLAEPAGRSCIFPNIGEERVITSVDVTIFRIREEAANPRFIVQYCSTENWFKSVLDNVGGTTHKRISRAALGKLLIPFPSIKEQTAIATVLSDMDDEIAAIEQRRAKTKDIKQAMMQELLTGKTRLVTPRGSNV